FSKIIIVTVHTRAGLVRAAGDFTHAFLGQLLRAGGSVGSVSISISLAGPRHQIGLSPLICLLHSAPATSFRGLKHTGSAATSRLCLSGGKPILLPYPPPPVQFHRVGRSCVATARREQVPIGSAQWRTSRRSGLSLANRALPIRL